MFHQGIERGEIAGLDVEIAMKLTMGVLKSAVQEAYCFGDLEAAGRVQATLTEMLVNAFPGK